MPIDPSIISNSFANMSQNMPDVNALMQQRVQGAENIYQIETARQAQAAQAEKEAAQQAAEAMLPAVASAFSDPSDAGLDAATSLLPPEVATAFTPFMQRLKGIADPKMRMTILRAELAKDKEGQFILNQLEPTANMRLQAETASQRLAYDKAKLAAEAEQGPEGSYSTVKGGDGKMYVMNNKTGEMRPAKADDGTAITSESAAVEGLDPKTKAKFDQALPKAKAALRTTFSAYANDIADVQALLADDAGIAAITGAFNAYTPDIAKDATRAAGRLNKIRAGNMFSALQELRTNSPTGAAVGNVSNEEGRNLRDSVAALDRAQSADDFKRALAKLAVDLEVARRNVAAAFDDTYGYRNDVTSTDIETEARAIREAAEREVGKTTPLPTQQPSGYRIINQRPQR